MPTPLSAFPKVPILGAAAPTPTCHYSAAQACVTCDCGSALPIMIPGLDRAGLCSVCQTKWIIASLRYENLDGRMTLDIRLGKWHGPMAASRDADLPKIDLT